MTLGPEEPDEVSYTEGSLGSRGPARLAVSNKAPTEEKARVEHITWSISIPGSEGERIISLGSALKPMEPNESFSPSGNHPLAAWWGRRAQAGCEESQGTVGSAAHCGTCC